MREGRPVASRPWGEASKTMRLRPLRMHGYQRLQFRMLACEFAVLVHVGSCVFLSQQRADFFKPLRELIKLR